MFIFVWYIEGKNERVNMPMEINRVELKERSKDLIARSKPSVISAGLIYLVLNLLFILLLLRLLTMNYTITGLQQYAEYLQEGNNEYAAIVKARMAPPAYTPLINLLLGFVLSLVGNGFTLFLINTVRGTGACYGNLLDAFPLFFKFFLLNLLTTIFVILWSLLLCFPGLVASYRYRMAPYILLNNPEKSVMECIRESKQRMAGYKGHLFVLDLSFIGWNILISIPIVGLIAQIWIMPYMCLTYVLFYEKLYGGDIYAADRGLEFPPPPIDY